MKVLYFDCYSGISGDMILGALTELGLDIHWLTGQLQSIPLKGLVLEPQPARRGALSGTLIKVCIPEPGSESDSPHHHRRTLRDFVSLLEQSPLCEDIRGLSIRIFTAIARAEAKAHGKSIDEIHFHELGYLDSVVDIVGAVMGVKALGIDKIFSSPLNLGTGFVHTGHGTIPVPAPATLELLANVPVYSTGIPHELVTPTGAAIISHLASGFGPMPSLCIQKTGYGAGTTEIGQIPNFLRVIMGTTAPADWHQEQVSMLETDIDDMNPEIYDYLTSRLFSAGALDVSLIPLAMKKNRPATRISVLTTPPLIDELCSIIFQETSTLGIRIKDSWRKTLPRQVVSVATPFGPVRVKTGKLNGKLVTASPEYDDCRQIALKTHRPLKEIYQAALQAFQSMPVEP